MAQEKTPDVDYHIVGPAAASIPGDLAGTDPTYDRVFLVTNTGACTSTSSDSSNDGTFYDVYDVVSPGGTLADIEVVLGTLSDSFVYLYCTPFNPAAPMSNLVYGDDDGGVGFGSAITPADNIPMVAGQVYQIVVTSFSNGDTGSYTLVLGSDIVLAAPVPTAPGRAMIMMAAVLLGGAALLIRRRQQA